MMSILLLVTEFKKTIGNVLSRYYYGSNTANKSGIAKSIKDKDLDVKSFELISTLPLAKYFNEIEFIPTIKQNADQPIPVPGLFLNENIETADDIVYYTSREFNKQNSSWISECKAMGLAERLQQALMQSAMCPITAQAKYIVVKYNYFSNKYKNPNIVVFENKHPGANPAMTIEYELFNTMRNM